MTPAISAIPRTRRAYRGVGLDEHERARPACSRETRMAAMLASLSASTPVTARSRRAGPCGRRRAGAARRVASISKSSMSVITTSPPPSDEPRTHIVRPPGRQLGTPRCWDARRPGPPRRSRRPGPARPRAHRVPDRGVVRGRPSSPATSARSVPWPGPVEAKEPCRGIRARSAAPRRRHARAPRGGRRRRCGSRRPDHHRADDVEDAALACHSLIVARRLRRSVWMGWRVICAV